MLKFIHKLVGEFFMTKAKLKKIFNSRIPFLVDVRRCFFSERIGNRGLEKSAVNPNKDQINNKMYTRTKHRPLLHLFEHYKDVVLKNHIYPRMDNTDIYKIALRFITPLAA